MINSVSHTTVNPLLPTLYAPNIGAPNYIKQILTDLKGQINSYTIIIENFNTKFTSVDISSRQKISKETLALEGTQDGGGITGSSANLFPGSYWNYN